MFKRLRLRTVTKLRKKLRGRYVPLWGKSALVTSLLFIFPFVILSYFSIQDNIRSKKDSLYQNFYLRAHAFSLEVRSYLKDKVDLEEKNSYLLARSYFSTTYDLPVPESVQLNAAQWLADKDAGTSYIDFFIEPKNSTPRILYLERHKGFRYSIFGAAFLSRLLDVSQNISADDRIFIYNVHEEPFLSNTIEAEYRVPSEWLARIHKLFWQMDTNSIQEIKLKEGSFIISRYQIRDLPLVIYIARPYNIAMREVKETTRQLLLIFIFVGIMVFIMLMYFFRDQVGTLRHLRAFILHWRRAYRNFQRYYFNT